jgi:ribosomal protein L11 methyltransferase
VVRRHAPYDLILSNIFAGPLSIMAKDLKRYLAPGGTVILSGLLTNQANRVIVAHRRKKLFLTRKICLGEWCILEFHC